MNKNEKLIDWIREYEAYKGEQVETIVFGEFDWGYTQYKSSPPCGKLMSLDEAMPYLAIEFLNDWGELGCPPFVAYTANWIISAYAYDGLVSAYSMRRNPVEGYIPYMPGSST